jgi:hypothetical protein
LAVLEAKGNSFVSTPIELMYSLQESADIKWMLSKFSDEYAQQEISALRPINLPATTGATWKRSNVASGAVRKETR